MECEGLDGDLRPYKTSLLWNGYPTFVNADMNIASHFALGRLLWLKPDIQADAPLHLKKKGRFNVEE